VPPVPYKSQFFDGVFAISIWSHFSEKVAMEWFVEMRRILKPGGFLFFTAHGLRSFYFLLETNSISTAYLAPLLAKFLCSQFVFETRFDNSFDCFGLEVEDWGDAYFSAEWIYRKLSQDWLLLDYQPGLNQLNQDVYVLCRT
jgi:SAM-dependent methyltransferase